MPSYKTSLPFETRCAVFLFLIWALPVRANAQIDDEAYTNSKSDSSCDPWAAAQGPLYMWGIDRGCELDAQATRDALTEIEITHHRSMLTLMRPARSATSGCSGAACIETLRQNSDCQPLFKAGAEGTVIGGRIEEGGAAGLRIHLWRYDLESGKSWEHEIDSGLCTNGACGSDRFADQELKRLRPGQRAAIALGLLLQGRVDNTFRSCLPGCQSEKGAKSGSPTAWSCQPFDGAACRTSSGESAAANAPTTLERRAKGPSITPLKMAKGWLAAGFAGSAASLIVLSALNASSVAHMDLPSTCGDSGKSSCGSLDQSFKLGVWISGGATALFGIGLAATLAYEYRHSREASRTASLANEKIGSAQSAPGLLSTCPLILSAAEGRAP